MEDQNVAQLRTIYEAYGKGDPQPLMDALHEEAHYRSVDPTPALQFSQVRQGKAEFIRALTMIATDYQLVYYRIAEYIAQRDHVVALAKVAFRHRAKDKLVEVDKADVWRFQGGKIVSFQEFFDSAKVERIVHGSTK
jgi:hypothetical protein